jgi:hypothetical protein
MAILNGSKMPWIHGVKLQAPGDSTPIQPNQGFNNLSEREHHSKPSRSGHPTGSEVESQKLRVECSEKSEELKWPQDADTISRNPMHPAACGKLSMSR